MKLCTPIACWLQSGWMAGFFSSSYIHAYFIEFLFFKIVCIGFIQWESFRMGSRSYILFVHAGILCMHKSACVFVLMDMVFWLKSAYFCDLCRNNMILSSIKISENHIYVGNFMDLLCILIYADLCPLLVTEFMWSLDGNGRIIMPIIYIWI